MGQLSCTGPREGRKGLRWKLRPPHPPNPHLPQLFTVSRGSSHGLGPEGRAQTRACRRSWLPKAPLRQTQATSSPVPASHLGPASGCGCWTGPGRAGAAGAAGSPLCGCGFQPGTGTCGAQGGQRREVGGTPQPPGSGAAAGTPPALPQEGGIPALLCPWKAVSLGCLYRRLGKLLKFSIFSIWFWGERKQRKCIKNETLGAPTSLG